MYFHATLSNGPYYIELLIKAATCDEATAVVKLFSDECYENEKNAIGTDAKPYEISGEMTPLTIHDGALYACREEFIFDSYAHESKCTESYDAGEVWMLESGANG